MKTITTLTQLPKENDFGIGNFEDYILVEVTASEGKNAVTMSFPWATSIPYMDVSVQDAVKKCEETTKKNLQMHLDRIKEREAQATLVEKFLRFLRRETDFLLSMTRLNP